MPVALALLAALAVATVSPGRIVLQARDVPGSTNGGGFSSLNLAAFERAVGNPAPGCRAQDEAVLRQAGFRRAAISAFELADGSVVSIAVELGSAAQARTVAAYESKDLPGCQEAGVTEIPRANPALSGSTLQLVKVRGQSRYLDGYSVTVASGPYVLVVHLLRAPGRATVAATNAYVRKMIARARG